MPAGPETRKDDHVNELILMTAGRDKSAFEELYRTASASVYAFALSILKNRHGAEDAMQQTFLSVWSAAPGYRPRANGMTWILAIAKNNAFMQLRKQKIEIAADPDELPENVLRLYGTDVASDESIMLGEALASLSDTERQVIFLHATSGLKHREIAKLLSLPLATVLSKYNRGLAKLRAELTGDAKNEQ